MRGEEAFFKKGRTPPHHPPTHSSLSRHTLSLLLAGHSLLSIQRLLALRSRSCVGPYGFGRLAVFGISCCCCHQTDHRHRPKGEEARESWNWSQRAILRPTEAGGACYRSYCCCHLGIPCRSWSHRSYQTTTTRGAIRKSQTSQISISFAQQK